MWHMPMHSAACELGSNLYCFSLYESICLFFKTSLLACNSFQIWWGEDNSILWLSFAQQKLKWVVKPSFWMCHLISRWDCPANKAVGNLACLFILVDDMLKTNCWFLSCNVLDDQGDQIGRIFAYWAIAFFGQILAITEVAQIFGLSFLVVKIMHQF
jgi:hypothetical protein